MRRLLALACAIVLVDTIFYAALTPLVPYFNEEFGLSKSAVGVLSGAYGAGVLVGSAPGAYLKTAFTFYKGTTPCSIIPTP